MRSIDDPFSMTRQQRRGEVASILAAGILRLHVRAAISDGPKVPEISPDSPSACLEVPGETVLSVSTVVNGRRETTKRRDV